MAGGSAGIVEGVVQLLITCQAGLRTLEAHRRMHAEERRQARRGKVHRSLLGSARWSWDPARRRRNRPNLVGNKAGPRNPHQFCSTADPHPSVIWGVIALVGLVANAIYWIAVIGPLYEDLMLTAMDLSQRHSGMAQFKVEGMGSIAGVGGAIVSIILLAPYPILQLANFTRAPVKEVMTG